VPENETEAAELPALRGLDRVGDLAAEALAGRSGVFEPGLGERFGGLA
jgi:hypothetical protein